MERVTIDEERCIGSGECALAAPNAFKVGSEGYAITLAAAHSLAPEQLEQIVLGCPSGAISVIEPPAKETGDPAGGLPSRS